jgi:signal transduction histidine kinase
VTVATSAENGRMTIKVKDNGTGIPDAIKEKIISHSSPPNQRVKERALAYH